MSNISTNLDPLIHDATLYLHETKSILGKLPQIATDDEDSSDGEKILTIQLILQYRLSGEDALSFLLKIDQNLLYLLGIQPQHSAKMNIDRLAYAVGNEDLRQLLTILGTLASSLSKIIARYKSSHTSFSFKDKKPQKQHMMTKALAQLLDKQKQFLDVLQKLNLEIEHLLKLQASGPILDHIATLRGPISQFSQAIIDGLEQAKQLYHQVNKTPLLDYQLDTLLKKTDQVLHSIPSPYNPHPHYPIKQFDHPMTSEQLEQRAAAKRLRPFFG